MSAYRRFPRKSSRISFTDDHIYVEVDRSVLTSVCSNILQKRPVHIARWIKFGMNQSVNPCNDFYSYVCGSWDKNSEKIGFTEKFNYFSIAKQSIITQAISILKEKFSVEDNFYLRKEKQWFSACMFTSSVANGFNKMQRVLKETRRFPNTTQRDWQYVAFYYAAEFYESVFFDIGLNKDNVLRLDKPLSRNSGFFDQTYKDLLEAVESIYNKYFTRVECKRERKTIMKNLFGFIYNLMESMKSKSDRVKIMTIQKFQNKYNSFVKNAINAKINWLNYFQNIIHNTGRMLKDSDKIEVNLSYFKRLCILLGDSPNETIVNYINIITIMYQRRSWFVSPDMLNLNNSMKSYYCFTGMPIQKGITNRILQKKLGKKKNWVKNIFEKLRNVHIEEVKKSWISDDLKETFEKFLQNLKFRWHGHTNIYESDKLSYKFDITNSVLQNIINFNKAQIKYKMEIYSSRQNNQRTKRQLETLSHYESNSNEICDTPLVLLLPVFSMRAPNSWNLGNIGYILSYEISHAAIKATFHNADATAKLRSSKIHCLKNQSIDLQVNDKDGYDESLVEYQGLNAAFKLFMNISESNVNSKDEIFNGLNFTAKELFFMSLATTYCESSSHIQYTQGMTYIYNKIKINNIVSNFMAFADTFSCSSNSNMNAKDKCNLFE